MSWERSSETTTALVAALQAALAEMPDVTKDAKVNAGQNFGGDLQTLRGDQSGHLMGAEFASFHQLFLQLDGDGVDREQGQLNETGKVKPLSSQV